MKRSLIDTGPLVALFDKDDEFHEAIKEFLKKYEGTFIYDMASNN